MPSASEKSRRHSWLGSSKSSIGSTTSVSNRWAIFERSVWGPVINPSPGESADALSSGPSGAAGSGRFRCCRVRRSPSGTHRREDVAEDVVGEREGVGTCQRSAWVEGWNRRSEPCPEAEHSLDQGHAEESELGVKRLG